MSVCSEQQGHEIPPQPPDSGGSSQAEPDERDGKISTAAERQNCIYIYKIRHNAVTGSTDSSGLIFMEEAGGTQPRCRPTAGGLLLAVFTHLITV